MPYKIQIDDDVRDATTDETARIDALRGDVATQVAALQAEAAAKASARAKLRALGLTDAEIAALVG